MRATLIICGLIVFVCALILPHYLGFGTFDFFLHAAQAFSSLGISPAKALFGALFAIPLFFWLTTKS
jgi:uncharacterized membrane protein